MATLFDVTLDLARHSRGVKRYKISQVFDDGQSFASASMHNVTGEYTGGTVWITSGNNAGSFARIKRASGQKITMEDDAPAVGVGDVVMICPWIDFDLDDLIEAINSVLYRYPVLAIDDSMHWESGVTFYELPDGVSDIRKVQIANTMGGGTLSHCWIENGGFLEFHSEQPLYLDGGMMRVWYKKYHGELYNASDELHPWVDLNYLRNMAFLHLWRNVIIVQHKDNPVAADMYNEAKVYESEYLKFNIPERKIPIRSFYTR